MEASELQPGKNLSPEMKVTRYQMKVEQVQERVLLIMGNPVGLRLSIEAV